MISTPTREQDGIRVYTDVPARFTQLPSGYLDFETDCNVLVQRVTTNLTLPVASTRLSIRSAFHGERHFETDGGHFIIDDDRYLIFNCGQTVSSSLQSPTPVECVNVTFQPEFAEEVLHSLVTPDDRLLDDPASFGNQPVEFPVKSYPHDDKITPLLQRLRAAVDADQVTPDWLGEQFHLLLERMLEVHRDVNKEIDAIPAVRASTRIELYQRLHRARDFIDSCYGQSTSLQDIAVVACLSPHHLLRLFKQVFKQTPHQYLTGVRMRQSRRLLATTELPVTEICFMVGFESLGSFSWLFRQTYGQSPSAFRANQHPPRHRRGGDPID